MSKIVQGSKWLKSRLITLSMIIPLTLVGMLASSALVSADRNSLHSPTGPSMTIATNGSSQWNNDKEVTAPVSMFSPLTSHTMKISPLFDHYYQMPGKANSLGPPVTVAFPIQQGWMQFFASGALFIPTTLPVKLSETTNALSTFVGNGVKDAATGVIRLPLLQALLTDGSTLPIDSTESTLNYLDLRKAAAPSRMLPIPSRQPTTSQSTTSKQEFFIKGGTRASIAVGHFIAQPFWEYINNSAIAPDGWEQDFGTPLTEALSFTLSSNGHIHHMLIQIFSSGGLIYDPQAADSSASIQPLTTGVDYLHTIGFPDVTLAPQQTVWLQEDGILLNTPTTGRAIAHIGTHFALTPLGDTRWTAGTLWYHVRLPTPASSVSGWIEASTVTFVSPGNKPAWASLDALSPALMAYLTSLGSNAGVVVYDIAHQRYYSLNGDTPFIVASSMKVPILLTFFNMIEQQEREPSDDEMNLLTTMIENSDNDSASALYYDEIGGPQGITDFLNKVGVSGLDPDGDAWGYSTITPQAMVDLLALLYQGKILTRQDRAIALNLMQNIESDQQVGVGDTAPQGATVSMKDGWVPGPDDLWAMNSSGIVTIDKETYIIAAYIQEQPSLDDGQNIVRHICGSVSSLFNH